MLRSRNECRSSQRQSSRLDKRFLGIDVLLKVLRRVAEKIAARRNYLCYRGGPKVRNCGRKRPEAKTSGMPPPEGNFKMSPGRNSPLASATKRLPELSKARPRGVVRPVANGLFTPVGLK